MTAFIQPPILNGRDLPKALNAPTGLFLVSLPRVVSDTISTYPNVSIRIRYTRRKIPPPYLAAR